MVQRSSAELLYIGLSEFVCDPDEEVTAVLALKQGSYFLFGTVRHQIGEMEPSAGRLLLFTLEAGESGPRGERGRVLNMNLVATQNAEGCVYALVEVQHGFAAAVNTSVGLAVFSSSRILTRQLRWTSIQSYGRTTLRQEAHRKRVSHEYQDGTIIIL